MGLINKHHAFLNLRIKNLAKIQLSERNLTLCFNCVTTPDIDTDFIYFSVTFSNIFTQFQRFPLLKIFLSKDSPFPIHGFPAAPRFKGATSRILHLERAGKFFQVGHPKSILISLIRSHPCLGLVYYYFFGVFLPWETSIVRFFQ